MRKFLVGVGVTAIGLFLLYESFPEAEGVARCPKVEYRVKVSRDKSRLRLDTITTIPEGCR